MRIQCGTDRRYFPLLLIGLTAVLPLLCGCPAEHTPRFYVERLGTENEEKQRRAVEELTRMQEKALPILEPALESPDPQMRIGALKVLAKVRRMSSVQMAGRLLDAPEKEVRLQAIDTVSQLAGLWKERSTELLAAALQQQEPEGVKKAAQSLMQMSYEDATEVLEQSLDPPDTIQAVYAARYLHEMRPSEKTANLLLQNLLNRDEQVEKQEELRRAKTAIQSLVKEESEKPTEALRQQLDSPNTVRAVYAARYLHEREPSEKTAELLVQSLLAEDEQLQQAAEESVQELGGAIIELLGQFVDAHPGNERLEEMLLTVRSRLAAEESVKELADRIVEPLVRFVDAHPGNERLQEILVAVRDKLIEELDKILDGKRAAVILDALATIADGLSVDEIKEDMLYGRLESRWRIAAATALGKAARSPRCRPELKADILEMLESALESKGMDNRVRIGAAIALCRLRSQNGVDYLLEQLDQFQEKTRAEAKLSASELAGLTEARIRAQEALTASGDFVVNELMDRLRKQEQKPGPIIVWAAAKTLGELSVEEAVPLLAPYLLKERETAPRAAGPEQGEEPPPDPITVGPEGRLSEPIQLENWDNPDEETVARLMDRMEIFDYPGYVRWTVAIALGRIGSDPAREALRKAARAEEDFLDRLRANKQLPEPYRRAALINGMIRRHQDVLFYIRRALQETGAGTPAT